MPTLGVLSDIHGNRPALAAVLDAFETHTPTPNRIVCLGDLVGLGGWSSHVVERVRATVDVTVYGNHDIRVFPEVDYQPYTVAETVEHDLVTAQLTTSQREWLASLPEKTTLAGDVHLVHSHPDPDPAVRWTRDGYIATRDFVTVGSQYVDGGILLLGHTHDQHAVDLSQFDGQAGLIANPGSVGMPLDGTAHYAVIDTDTQDVTLASTDYDASTVRDRLQTLGQADVLNQSQRRTQPRDRDSLLPVTAAFCDDLSRLDDT